MCVCLLEQSEIGGAGGGLTGEQVDSGHTHRTGHQVSLLLPPPVSQRKSHLSTRKCDSGEPLWVGWEVLWMLPPDGWTSTSEPLLMVGSSLLLGGVSTINDF